MRSPTTVSLRNDRREKRAQIPPKAARCLVRPRAPDARGEHRAACASWCDRLKCARRFLEVESRPRRAAHLAGAGEGECEKFQRGADRRTSVEVIDGAQQCAEPLFVGDRGAQLGIRAAAMRLATRKWGRRRAQCTTAKRKTVPMIPRSRRAVSRRPLFSIHLEQEQELGRRDLGDRTSGERRSEVLQQPFVLRDRRLRRAVGLEVFEIFLGDRAEGVARGGGGGDPVELPLHTGVDAFERRLLRASRFVRASASGLAGKGPSASIFSTPAKR